MAEIRVDGARLWGSLMTMAEIGATPNGGVNRQTLTDEDRRGRDLFRTWCEEAGLQISVDRMGSMSARRNGTDADSPQVGHDRSGMFPDVSLLHYFIFTFTAKIPLFYSSSWSILRAGLR